MRGYKPEYYTLLTEDMFTMKRDKKVFRALKNGYQFSMDNMGDLRKVAGITVSELVSLVSLADKSEDWITEGDVIEFAREYREKEAKKCIKAGDVEGAYKFMQEIKAPNINIIEDYKRTLIERRSRADEGLLGLPTGISSLDAVTSGLQKSKIWIVGGYNAYGKTFFLTNLANRIIDLDRRACIVTLEMTKEDILDRMIAERLSLGVYELAKTVNKEKVEEQVDVISEHIKKNNLCVLDSNYEIGNILERLRIENANRQIDVVLIDFIQLIQDSEVKSNYESLSRIASKLQETAKELGVCMVILSQISNEAQRGSAGSIYGFKGAGEIGQIADVAVRIKRYKDEITGLFTKDYDLDLIKNRSGEIGLVKCNITFPGGKITQSNL
jgi:replicative DNA helicase